MSLKNKKADMTPFDMRKKPVKQFLPLAWIMWAGTRILTPGLTIRKKGMEGLKPPYLVISTHQGFSDYYILPRVLFPHRANYVSDMEGFAAFGDWVYRHIGCIGKRRYVPEMNVVKNIRYALHTLKRPVVVFPESRHCDAGVTSNVPKNLGKLAKVMKVPVVTVTNHGSYLGNPFWDEIHSRKLNMESNAELLLTAEEVRTLSEQMIQQKIEEKLQYDEYEWQLTNKITIDHPNGARGLHLPLYRCLRCGREGAMESDEHALRCTCCNASWKLNSYGQLEKQYEEGTVHIPDWYRWEREEVNREIAEGRYHGIDCRVRVEALPNAKGFVPLGIGRLRHNRQGFELQLEEQKVPTADTFPLKIANASLESVQTEYNYRERGKCIVLSTRDCCYYVYSDEPEFVVTKLEFAVENIGEDTSVQEEQ